MSTVPPRASSVWDATPPARGTRGQQLREIRAAAKQQADQRRARVLAHPWACERLCKIFGYKDATQWNGYVPPKADPLPDRGPQVALPNTAPHRAALVQLLRDVAEFDRTGQMPGATLDAVQLPLAVDSK
jgi:hypothetical protein